MDPTAHLDRHLVEVLNFSLAILAVVVLSVMPAVVESVRHRREAKRAAADAA